MNLKTWIVSACFLFLVHYAGIAQNTPQESLDSSRALVSGNYVNGKKDGVWDYFSAGKILLARHFYKDGVKINIWEFYDGDGSLSWTYDFNNGQANYLKANTAGGYYAYQGPGGQWVKSEPDKKTIWLNSEAQWQNFQELNLRYPESAVKQRVQGKVSVKVTVDENGNPIAYAIQESLNPKLDAVALSVVKAYGPEFVPAEKMGAKVKFIYIIKVNFRIQQG